MSSPVASMPSKNSWMARGPRKGQVRSLLEGDPRHRLRQARLPATMLGALDLTDTSVPARPRHLLLSPAPLVVRGDILDEHPIVLGTSTEVRESNMVSLHKPGRIRTDPGLDLLAELLRLPEAANPDGSQLAGNVEIFSAHA